MLSINRLFMGAIAAALLSVAPTSAVSATRGLQERIPVRKGEADKDDQEKTSGQKEDEKDTGKNVEKDKIPAGGNKKASPGRKSVAGDTLEIAADRHSMLGDIVIYEGYVVATLNEMRLQSDRVTYNTVTGDMIATGNVIFDQSAVQRLRGRRLDIGLSSYNPESDYQLDQRITAKKAEINWSSGRGTFWDVTGFTNRTTTGEYVYFTADRADKTGVDTFDLINAKVTACEDVIPKWSFSASRANSSL